jgi:hypothetical protein
VMKSLDFLNAISNKKTLLIYDSWSFWNYWSLWDS